jgi:hypothetical protein
VRPAARVVGTIGAMLASLVLLVPDAGTSAVLGKQRLLTVLVSYGPRPFTRASVTTSVNEAVAFVSRSSFGRVTLQPTTTPWLDGGTHEPSCAATSDAMFAPLRAVAAAAGYQAQSYNRVVYVVAGPNCGFHGIEFGNEVLIVREPNARLIVHELGHTFGLPHAGAAAVCGTWCVTQEQGDLYSPMGIGFADFSAYEKEQLGWIPRQARVTRPGKYFVYPISPSAITRQALVIQAPEGEYWLEQRPGLATPGLIVRLVNPETASRSFIAPTTLLLAPIRTGHPVVTPGQTFRVPGEFSVKVARIAKTPMRLQVSLSAALRGLAVHQP